ncbi:hypothetical protein DT594_15425 [Halopseudomonas laoshanensis]|uniref:Uncharacterized protein n=2 Tax=Halopseudomonas laoshanensis TaxID=2268758 RepID=A0A7V7GRY9_9GAMM|nr:hypothetical protein DT594_15425 [Halopseudomonas laoshanensis]
MHPAYQAHLAGLIFIAILALGVFVFPASKGTHQGLLFLASLAFAIGFSIWSWPKVKEVWRHPIGRALIIIPHLFVLLLAVTIAKNVVASALGLPPQDFDVSVNFIALLFYIPAWSIVVSILVGIFAFLLYVIALFVGVFRHPFKETAKLFGHAAGALAICIYSSSVFDFANNNEKSLHPLVRWVAFFGDFQSADAYPGIGAAERIRLHENGVISVATAENNTVVIRVRKYEQ